MSDILSILTKIAAIKLWRDTYPDGPDTFSTMVGGVNAYLTPNDVREAREWMRRINEGGAVIANYVKVERKPFVIEEPTASAPAGSESAAPAHPPSDPAAPPSNRAMPPTP